MSTFEVVNPFTEEVICKFDFSSQQQVELALERSTKAAKILLKMAAFERAEILEKLVQLLRRDKEEIATIISQEMGKSISEAMGEMNRSILTIECSAMEARRIEGEVLDSDSYGPARNKLGITIRRPLGVVLAITPFNFPVNLSCHKIGPAFAAGNAIIFKPGPQNYLSGKKLYDLCVEAGMTDGMIEFLVPDVPEMNFLVSHPKVAAVSFTGGLKTAQAIAKNAGIKKLLFELGGNDPMIVMDDGDVEKAVDVTIAQRFASSGQRCTACKRLFIHEKVYTQFRDLLVEKTKKIKVGNPLEKDTIVGPVVNIHAAKQIEARIQDAVAKGAKLLHGGARSGCIIEPTILENVDKNCELVKDETFGPVAPLFKFNDLDEIIPYINGTIFGLQSGVFTNNLAVIKKLFYELEVGAMAVNDGPGFRADHFPFGGVKLSGLGREGVKYAIEEMSHIKTLIL